MRTSVGRIFSDIVLAFLRAKIADYGPTIQARVATPQRDRARKQNPKKPQRSRWKAIALGFGLKLPGGTSGAVASLTTAIGVRAAGFVVAKPGNSWQVNWAGHWGAGGRNRALETGKRAIAGATVVQEDAIGVPIFFMGRCVAAVVVPSGTDPNVLARESLQACGISAIVREAAFEMLAWESRTDALTGLANPRYIRKLIDEAAAGSKSVSLMMIDVDHFRLYNEKWGHEAGNLALIEVARAITRAAGPRAIVGRYGGEEFVVAISELSRLQCVRAAERIRAEITSAHLPEGKGVTASIGCAVFPDDAEDVGALVRVADYSMYRAKRNGRDRVEVFTPGSDDLAADRLAGVSVVDLAEALRAIKELQDDVESSSHGHLLDQEQVRFLVASRLLEEEGGAGGAQAAELLTSLARVRPRGGKKSA